KDGDLSEEEAIERLEHAPYWVWTAMDPKSKLLVVVDVGCRTLAMAQRVVHQVTRVLARGCLPLFMTDGLKDYGTALLTHSGYWMQPERHQDKGPRPKPRWMPLPALLYAQVVKSYRRRRIVGVKHRVVFGTRLAIEQILTRCGWRINTAFVERLNLDAQFIAGCSSAKPCEMGENLLSVSDPISRPKERLIHAGALIRPPTLQRRPVSNLYPYTPVERSPLAVSPVPEPGR